MQRVNYFNQIEERLSFLVTRIELRGKLNILDINVHSEQFYADFLNLIFGWSLKNLNRKKKNAAGIDLLDDSKRIVCQVSATATKAKVESALAKDLAKYKGYSFKFIAISKDASKLKRGSFTNPHKLCFDPQNDVLDVSTLLSFIGGEDLDKQREYLDFLKKEVRLEPDTARLQTHFATIIGILAREPLNCLNTDFETSAFDIQRKIDYSKLSRWKILIHDHKIHHPRIQKIYDEFDRQGNNKTMSIMNRFRTVYASLRGTESPDEVFDGVINQLVDIVNSSPNFEEIASEEVELYVQILAVDAFIRCKVFEHPPEEAR